MSSDRPGIFRRLAVVPAVLLVAMALVGPTNAFAAEGTSGYSQEPNKPGTTTTTTTPTPAPSTPTTSTPTTSTTPATETSPSKESTTPATETSPTTSTSAPSTAKAAKASTLPFTGFDLRWSVAMGLLLIGAGVSLIVVQRRQHGARR